MNIKIGTAPDSWGVWFPSDPRQTPWNRYLDELVEAGYGCTELGPYGYLPTDLPTPPAELARRGITVAGTSAMAQLEDPAAWPELQRQRLRAEATPWPSSADTTPVSRTCTSRALTPRSGPGSSANASPSPAPSPATCFASRRKGRSIFSPSGTPCARWTTTAGPSSSRTCTRRRSTSRCPSPSAPARTSATSASADLFNSDSVSPTGSP